MSHDALPIESDLVLDIAPMPEQATAPAEDAPSRQDAQALHDRLNSAFGALETAAPSTDSNPADIAHSIAAAGMRQAQAFQDFAKRVDTLDQSADIASLQEGLRGLCDALLQITVQTKQASTEADGKFESLTDAMAILSGYVASHRTELQNNIAATKELSAELQRLRDESDASRAETTELRDLVRASDQALRTGLAELKEQLWPLAGELGQANQRLASVEEQIASYPRIAEGVLALHRRIADLDGLQASVAELSDKDLKVSDRCSVLADELEATRTQVTALIEGADHVAQRMQTAEQVVTALYRREKILAGLHTRAARTLQAGS